MPRLNAVIFDLDDTLYPEIDYVMSGFRHVAHWSADRWRLRAETVFEELLAIFRSGNSHLVFNHWLEQKGLNIESKGDMIVAYRSHPPTLHCEAAIVRLLTNLRQSFLLGLLSDGHHGTQKLKFDSLKLQPFFSAVVFSDILGREHWKPHPLPYQIVTSKLGVRTDEAVYVGDNPQKDFWGARIAGMASIRFRRESGVYADLEPEFPDQAPDAEARSIDELITCITHMAQRS